MSFDDDEPEGLDETYNEPEYEVVDESIKITKNNVHIRGSGKTTKSKDEKTIDDLKKKVKKEKKKEPEPYPKGRNDFEKTVKLLQRNQYNVWEDPKNHYCDITIPKKVTLGEDLVIKLSKKVAKVEYVFGDGYDWKKKNVYDNDSDFDISPRRPGRCQP